MNWFRLKESAKELVADFLNGFKTLLLWVFVFCAVVAVLARCDANFNQAYNAWDQKRKECAGSFDDFYESFKANK